MKNLKSYFYSLPLIKINKNWVETHQQNIKIHVQSKLRKHIIIIEICSSYSWEILINALTVSSLIQVSIKLLCSLFFIKIDLFLQLGLLFVLLPMYLKFNTFDYIRTKLATFIHRNISESIYEETFAQESFENDFLQNPDHEIKNAWHNRILLFFIHFFITFRLFILQQPWLSIILKFIAVRYFILNEYLFIAYLISFIFIFSRFIFLLSDKTLSSWRFSLQDLLENKEEVPKVTKENIKIMTHWSLRYLRWWEIEIKKEKYKNYILENNNYFYIPNLKDKFNLKEKKIKTKGINKVIKTGLIFLLINYICYKYYFDIGLLESSAQHMLTCKSWGNKVSIIKIPFGFPTKQPKKIEEMIFKKTKNHFVLAEKKISKETNFTFFRYTAFSSIKDVSVSPFNVPPWKTPLKNPPFQTEKGFEQGLAGITFQTCWKEDFQGLFEAPPKSISNSILPLHLQKLQPQEVFCLSQHVDHNNIVIMPEHLNYLTEIEIFLLDELLKTKYPLSLKTTKCLWAAFEKQSVNTELRTILLNVARSDIENVPELARVLFFLDLLIKNPNFYVSSFFSDCAEKYEIEYLKNKNYNPILPSQIEPIALSLNLVKSSNDFNDMSN